MRKTMLGSAIGLGMWLMLAAPSFAADSAVNMDTGFWSKNTVKITKNTKTEVSNSQDSMVLNDLRSRTNTGKNVVLGNTKTTGLVGSGGSAKTTTAVTTNTNYSEMAVNGCGCDAGANTVKNEQTGFGSTNDASITKTDTVTVSNSQTAFVVNTVSSSANTGHNMVIGNTKADGVAAGSAVTTTGVTTNANYSGIYVNAGMP